MYLFRRSAASLRQAYLGRALYPPSHACAAAPFAEVRVLFIATTILRCARNLRSGVFIGTINRTNRPILWTNRPEPIPATIAAQDFDEMPGAVRCRGVIHTHTPCRMSRAHPGQAIQIRGPCARCGERFCLSCQKNTTHMPRHRTSDLWPARDQRRFRAMSRHTRPGCGNPP